MLGRLWAIVQMNVGRLRSDEQGVTLLEYAAIAFLILVVCLIVLGTVGTNINQVFQSIADALPGG